jgi:serine/threonine protein kinase/Leucine-rich repeat (LRR) protein
MSPSSALCISSNTSASFNATLEYNALVDFYTDLNGDRWSRNNNWLSSQTVTSRWSGLTVGDSGTVTDITTSRYGLRGTLPSSISGLTGLSFFNVNDEEALTGTLPSTLGQMTAMEYIKFRKTTLTGTIPAEIACLTKLTYMSFIKNPLTGPLLGPTGVWSLTGLREFYIITNSITGTLPGGLFALGDLEVINFNTNSFTGPLPNTYGNNLTSLTRMTMLENSLTGTIPEHFSVMTNNGEITLGDNCLSGSIPDIFSGLTRLHTLEFDGNNFTGTLPTSIASLTALGYLDIRGDNWSPTHYLEGLCGIVTLYTFRVDGMTACYPACLQSAIDFNADQPDLERCQDDTDAALCLFQDAIEFGDAERSVPTVLESVHPYTDTFSLEQFVSVQGATSYSIYFDDYTDRTRETSLKDDNYHCYIEGANQTLQCPESGTTLEFESNEGFTFFYYSQACFKSSCWGYKVTIEAFLSIQGWSCDSPSDLVRNDTLLQHFGFTTEGRVNGSYSEDYCTWTGVACSLPGSESLRDSGVLHTINLDAYDVTGTLPDAIGIMTDLRFLSLESNSLDGTLPTTMGNMKSLTYLNLRHNNFEGSLEGIFSGMSNLRALYIGNNQFSGPVPLDLTTLGQLEDVILSSNSFTGKITQNFCALSNASFDFSILADVDCYEPCFSDLLTTFKFGTMAECSPTSVPTSFPTLAVAEGAQIAVYMIPLAIVGGLCVLLAWFLRIRLLRQAALRGLPVQKALLSKKTNHWSEERIDGIVKLIDSHPHSIGKVDYDGHDALDIVLHSKVMGENEKKRFCAALIMTELHNAGHGHGHEHAKKAERRVSTIIDFKHMVHNLENVLSLEHHHDFHSHSDDHHNSTFQKKTTVNLLVKLVETDDNFSIVEHVVEVGRDNGIDLSKCSDGEGRLVINLASPKCMQVLKYNTYLLKRYEFSDNRNSIYKSSNTIVYRAHDHVEDTQVVLKLMKHSCDYMRELEAHENDLEEKYVVPVLEAFDATADDKFSQELKWFGCSEYPYLLVFLAGENSLSDVLKNGGSMSMDDIQVIMKQVVQAVGSLHSAGIIHGNITPHDIVKHEGKWKLCDLDVSEQIDLNISSAKYSSGYLPPERIYADADGKNVRVKIDSPAFETTLEGLQCGMHTCAPVEMDDESMQKNSNFDAAAADSQSADIPQSPTQAATEATEVADTPTTQSGNEDAPCAPTHTVSESSVLPADPAHDIWSLGAVLYMLVTNKSLFFVDAKDDIEEADLLILRNFPKEFKRERLKRVKHTYVRNLLSLMLSKSPSKRPSVKQILAHPFLSGQAAPRLVGQEAEFDVFISYRQNSDRRHVESIYDKLTAMGLNVWWDVKCLKPGVSWKKGFCEGLVKSRVFMPVLSRGAINNPNDPRANFSTLTKESPCDNVLLEHWLSLELLNRGLVEKIYPVMVGDYVTDPERKGQFTYDNYFAGGSHPKLSGDVVVESVQNELEDTLTGMGLGSIIQEDMSVSMIVKSILESQGSFIWGEMDKCLDKIADDVIHMERNSIDMTRKMSIVSDVMLSDT